jgi:hypothetical protein
MLACSEELFTINPPPSVGYFVRDLANIPVLDYAELGR